MHADEPYVREALHNGALGYVLKDCTPADLVRVIRAVTARRRCLNPALTDLALTRSHPRKGDSALDLFETLTSRERLVIQWAAEGNTSGQVATKLFISPRTAETHRANLMRKLGLRTPTDLVRFAIRRGLLPA